MAAIQKINELIEALGNAEKVTKESLITLSRDVLEYIMVDQGNGKASEDSQVANRLLDVLTPVNKKVCIAFLSHFLAFHTSKNEEGEFVSFGKKDKQHWDKKLDLVISFLAEPHNNVWTWADRNIEIAPKPMDFAKLNQAMGQLIKKAEKAHLGHENVIRAMLANGISLDELLVVIKAAGEQDKPAEEQDKLPEEQAA